MEILPAVDLYEGKVVRLTRGDYAAQTAYEVDPGKAAERWADQGARWLHVVDLDGARWGEIKNWGALEKIVAEKRVSVEFGGGVRQIWDIEKLLKMGVSRVILGTKVLSPGFLREATADFGDRIGLSLDLRGDQVLIEGWLKEGGRTVFELLEQLRGFRVACLVVTDIDRDGTLTGMDLHKMSHLLEETPHPLIVSGGISSLDDLRGLLSLRKRKLAGAIIGKALYEGRIDLKEALRLAAEAN
jgi:phosphoribosylformimino-5-aminoimidazole carboxamide ribotide isomerase